MQLPFKVKCILAPFFKSVTLSVSQICLPVLASRQTNTPDDLAENTRSPWYKAVEVLLRILVINRCGHGFVYICHETLSPVSLACCRVQGSHRICCPGDQLPFPAC